MSDLQGDLRAAIDKNLSVETAGVLRARLDSIDALEAEAKKMRDARDTFERHGREQSVRAQALEAQRDALQKVVDAYKLRETVLDNAERSVLVADMRREKAEAVANATREIVGIVFANATLKRTVMSNGAESVSVPIIPTGQTYSTGNATTNTNRSENSTETIEG